MKVLNLPPTSILPTPNGTVNAEDRAMLTVGYPISAVVVVVAEREATVMGIPAIRWKPQFYTEEFIFILPPIMAFVDDALMPLGKDALPIGAQTWVSIWEKQSNAEEILVATSFSSLISEQMLYDIPVSLIPWKGIVLEQIEYDLIIRGGKNLTDVQDVFKIGLKRKQLVAEYDRILGIE